MLSYSDDALTEVIVFHGILDKHQKMKPVEFANIVEPDMSALKELPHLDLHCLPSIL